MHSIHIYRVSQNLFLYHFIIDHWNDNTSSGKCMLDGFSHFPHESSINSISITFYNSPKNVVFELWFYFNLHIPPKGWRLGHPVHQYIHIKWWLSSNLIKSLFSSREAWCKTLSVNKKLLMYFSWWAPSYVYKREKYVKQKHKTTHETKII